MELFAEQLNCVMVEAYRSIINVEEKMLRDSEKVDLTINEIHLLEAVGKGKEQRRTISELAEDAGVTLPSVTVAINKLMKKGCVEKLRSDEDGRIVYVSLTKQGQRMDAVHRYFHEAMVHGVIGDMTLEESQALYRGVVKLNSFLKGKMT